MNRTCETCAYFVAKQDPTMGVGAIVIHQHIKLKAYPEL